MTAKHSDLDPRVAPQASRSDKKRQLDWDRHVNLVQLPHRDCEDVNHWSTFSIEDANYLLDTEYPRVEFESRDSEVVRYVNLVESAP